MEWKEENRLLGLRVRGQKKKGNIKGDQSRDQQGKENLYKERRNKGTTQGTQNGRKYPHSRV